MNDRQHLVHPLGILCIHASAVVVSGGALAFLGPSGAGKSTIRRLLSACGQPLADDRVCLIPRAGGEWEAASSDGHTYRGLLSEQEAAMLHGVPLRAILRLWKGSSYCLKPVDELATCRYLVHAHFELPWQQGVSVQSKKLALAGLATIARSVPGYDLHFERSPHVVAMLSSEMSLA